MISAMAQRMFKVVARTAWEDACQRGAFAGSADDRRDGFIHLSEDHQLAGTLARHFRGAHDLVLIELDAAVLGSTLRWEPSRGGDLFPHLYAELPTALAVSVRALGLDADGVPIIPEDICQC
jgi:uncharacterized protein (DUF952 family)